MSVLTKGASLRFDDTQYMHVWQFVALGGMYSML